MLIPSSPLPLIIWSIAVEGKNTAHCQSNTKTTSNQLNVSTHNKMSLVILLCGPKIPTLKFTTKTIVNMILSYPIQYNMVVRTVVEYMTESGSLNDVPNDEIKRSCTYTMTICSRNCSEIVHFFPHSHS